MDIRSLIEKALAEDLGSGDITTDGLIPADTTGRALVTAKEPAVLAGINVSREVFACLDPKIDFTAFYEDSQAIPAGESVFEVGGRLRALLKAERTALNFLQRLSGIATRTRSWVSELEGTGTCLVDTRKTTPGLRMLEKYAVRMGGAHNHRFGLFDGVLIKDNHIAACGGIAEAVKRARNSMHHLLKIEVEVTGPAEAEAAAAAGAEVIMLDNMTPEQIKEAVARVDGRALIEVSGGVDRENLKALAEAGADIISVGSLIHSAAAVDLSMNITPDQ